MHVFVINTFFWYFSKMDENIVAIFYAKPLAVLLLLRIGQNISA